MVFLEEYENFPYKPKEIRSFSPFSFIFPPVPPNNWTPPTQLKTFQIGIERGYVLRKFGLDKLKMTVSISNCKEAVFNYVFFCKKS